MSWGLAERRMRWGLTWRGWLILGAAAGLAGWGAMRATYPFLAVTHRVPSDTLVVESWLPDADLAAVAAEFGRGGYRRIVLTGGPIAKHDPNAHFASYPELMRATMISHGFAPARIVAVPGPWAARDRTYASGRALGQALAAAGAPPAIDVMTLGPHARRTRLLFEKALGPGVEVGIIAASPQDYDPRRWWTTSAGVREVMSEAIAYGYARCLFRARD